MAVTVLLTIHTKPDRSDDMVKFLADILGDSRAWNGCISISVTRDQADENEIYVVERWETRKDHEEYFAWRVESGTLSESLQYMEGGPVIRYFDELDA